jgi:hypothetical protein
MIAVVKALLILSLFDFSISIEVPDKEKIFSCLTDDSIENLNSRDTEMLITCILATSLETVPPQTKIGDAVGSDLISMTIEDCSEIFGLTMDACNSFLSTISKLHTQHNIAAASFRKPAAPSLDDDTPGLISDDEFHGRTSDQESRIMASTEAQCIDDACHRSSGNRLHSCLPLKPMLNLVEQSILILAVRRAPPDAIILEYGAGGSTLLIARSLCAEQRLVTIEHNPAWYEKVSRRATPLAA